MEKATKRRNSEKRKEKSRDAARCRRSRETEIFSSLAKELPLPDSIVSALDKASIMRIVISYLKLHDLTSLYSVPKSVSCPNKLYDSLFLQALDGFVLIASAEGDLVYLSENVHEYLGITQVDLMGNSVYEFSHPCDHDEIREVLAVKASPDSGYRSFFMRLKCTLTPKGRNVNLKSATYKVMHCSGQMVTRHSIIKKENGKLEDSKENGEGKEPQYLVAVAEPIPHPSNIEIPLDKQTFLSKHSLDMKFTYADEKMAEFLGYDPADLIDKSIYEFQHALDTPAVDKPFKTLFAKGQCETGRYRFLAKGGGYAWVMTQATIIYGNKGQKPVSVVCVHFIISGIENRDEVYSSSQLLGQKVPRPVSVTCSVISRLAPNVKSESASVASTPTLTPVRPQATTAKIFAPRTKDMNKGYLMFSAEEPGHTMLKDEPEDLTHLAPTAGDVDVRLDLPQLGDMFSDILADSYCPLLADDLSSSSCPSRTSGDPFFSYRDDSNSAHSPSDLDRRNAKSPGDYSLPSLCSPDHDDEPLGLMSLTGDSGGSELDEDLCLKAPYIPLDDLPLLIPAVDMMWSTSPSPSPPPQPLSTRLESSSLAELLRNSPPDPLRGVRCNKRTDHDWFKDTGQAKTAKYTSIVSGAENLLRKVPPGVGPPDRTGVKRAHNGINDTRSKRSRNEMSSQLLHQLMEPVQPPGSPPPSSRSHSVLMNLLDRVPKESKGPLAEVLKQLWNVSIDQPREEIVRQQAMRQMTSYLLQPGAAAIPSLSDLSQRDCEVNAPVDRNLLQGPDLINALDIGDNISV